MLHKFNEDSIYSKFIKGILASTHVPSVEIWKPNMNLTEGFTYITKDYILKAKKSYSSKEGKPLTSPLNSEYFQILGSYIEGNEYRNITTNYMSNTYEYDYETHKYLGNYLRMLRDLHGVDLMPYYNCLNGVSSSNVRIKDISTNPTTDTSPSTFSYKIITDNKEDDGLKTLLVPIRFNQDYTIYANCDTPVKIVSIFYDGFRKISDLADNLKIYNRMSISNPILYRKDQVSLDRDDAFYRNYLTLLIELPKKCNQVVVLEGNYKNNKVITTNLKNEICKSIISREDPDGNRISLLDLSDEDLNNYCKIIPSLTRSVDNSLFAYSDRLLEFLLSNAITGDDEITDNIKRIQDYTTSITHYRQNKSNFDMRYSSPGVWDNELRAYLYDLVTDKSKYKIDISGYVDKDVESVVTRGQNV